MVQENQITVPEIGMIQIPAGPFLMGSDEEYDEEEIAENLRDHALVISFAPIENPRIAVAVVIENGSSGSRVAAPIARAIMDEYLGSGSHATD